MNRLVVVVVEGGALGTMHALQGVEGGWSVELRSRLGELLLVHRLDGGLTIGDTHISDEPFPFDVDEAPDEHFLAGAAAILAEPPPPVVRRWAGVYSQVTDPALVYLRVDVASGVQVVTSPGGRGMTLATVSDAGTVGRAFDLISGQDTWQ